MIGWGKERGAELLSRKTIKSLDKKGGREERGMEPRWLEVMSI